MLRLRHFGFGLRLLAVVLIAATAAYVAWDLWERGSGVLQPSLRVAKPAIKKPVKIESDEAVSVQEDRTDAQIVATRNLFATADVAGPASGGGSASTENLAQTGLQLELLGTVSGSGAFSCAVIYEPGQKKSRIFRVGEQVGGATIAKILRRSVVLRISGREEILNMKAPSPGRNDIAPARPTAAESPQAGSGRDVLGELVNVTNARPHFEGGRMDGYYLGSVEEGSYFKRIGLQSGDIIEGVNDQAFTKPDDITQVKNLNRGPGVRNTLRIKRQGRPMTLNLD